MNQQLSPAHFTMKYLNRSTTENRLLLWKGTTSCNDAWQARFLVYMVLAMVVCSLCNQSRWLLLMLSLRHITTATIVAQNWLVWEITALAHSVGTYLKDLCPAVASCPAQIQKCQHQCALPSARSSSCWSNANSWHSLSDNRYSLFWPNFGHLPLQLIAHNAALPKNRFRKQLEKKRKREAPHKPKCKRNTSFLRWVKCTKCTRWCDDFSYDYRDHDSDTQKRVRSAPVARVDDGAARRCRQWARGFCLQTAKNFDVGEQVSQTWCVWTPPNQARFRHVRVGKMHRDERGEACHCVKMPLQRLHSCVLEEMSDNKCTVERERKRQAW